MRFTTAELIQSRHFGDQSTSNSQCLFSDADGSFQRPYRDLSATTIQVLSRYGPDTAQIPSRQPSDMRRVNLNFTVAQNPI